VMPFKLRWQFVVYPFARVRFGSVLLLNLGIPIHSNFVKVDEFVSIMCPVRFSCLPPELLIINTGLEFHIFCIGMYWRDGIECMLAELDVPISVNGSC
jgi:hypothetical protein